MSLYFLIFFFFLAALGQRWRRHLTLLGVRVLPFFGIVIDSIEGGVLIGLKNGEASPDIPLPKLPIDGVSLNGSPVSRGVELLIGLVRPNVDLRQLRDGNGEVIPRHL